MEDGTRLRLGDLASLRTNHREIIHQPLPWPLKTATSSHVLRSKFLTSHSFILLLSSFHNHRETLSPASMPSTLVLEWTRRGRPLVGSCGWRYPHTISSVMASTAAERLRFVYGLLAILYLGLCLDFYLTAQLWRNSGVILSPEDEQLLRREKRSYEDEKDVPHVEFYPNPQPTHKTEGYMWLTSYSRIPVSESAIVAFF
ncbi:hypothetical protein AVEN_222291-1 [Araneus ventricosus]|uniref:Uncharacterized protein n=1 Tax=Araneus ventricosus TaxID=182803 RepID=A0A4Y2NCT0_ARAVE|nr:hypothetical protein AVEN_222291-1 [Araneus ventricosus]